MKSGFVRSIREFGYLGIAATAAILYFRPLATVGYDGRQLRTYVEFCTNPGNACVDPMLAHSIEIALLSLAFIAFAAFVQCVSGSRAFAILAVVCSLASLDLGGTRGDAFFQVDILAPIGVALMFLSLLVYARSAKKAALVASLIGLLGFGFCLKAPLAMVLVPSVLAFAIRSRTDAIRDASIFLGAAFISAGVFHWTLVGAGEYLKLLRLAIPMLDRVADQFVTDRESGAGRNASYDAIAAVSLYVVLSAIAAAATVALACQLSNARRRLALMSLGVSLFAGAASLGIQTPYLSMFGLGLILAASLDWLTQKTGEVRYAACGSAVVLIFVVISGNMRVNDIAVERASKVWKTLADLQVARVLFASAAPSSGVRFANSVALSAGGELVLHSRTLGDFGVSSASPDNAVHELFISNAADKRNSIIGHAFVLLQFPSASVASTFMTGLHANSFGYRFDVLNGDSKTLLLDVRRTCGRVEPGAFLKPQRVPIDWKTGFYALEQANPIPFETVHGLISAEYRDGRPWRFSQSNAMLRIGRSSCGKERVSVPITVYSAYPSQVWVRSNSSKLHVHVDQSGTSLAVPVRLNAGEASDITISSLAPRVPQMYAVQRSERAPESDIHLVVVAGPVAHSRDPESP